jgi:hypothetical protein
VREIITAVHQYRIGLRGLDQGGGLGGGDPDRVAQQPERRQHIR